MRITVYAKPNAPQDNIEKISDLEYKVFVTKPPVKGLANRAIIKLLSEYFNVSESAVNIVFGHISRKKIIEIQNPS